MNSFIFSMVLSLALLAGGNSADPDAPWREGVTSPRIETLRKQVQSGNPTAVSQFWEEVKSQSGPLVEEIPADSTHLLVTFLYRATGPTKSVVLYNQLNADRDESKNVLARLLETDVWYKTFWIQNDMRLSYSLVPNPTEASLNYNKPELRLQDPLNPNSLPPGTNIGRSVLELPAAPPQSWIKPDPAIPSRELEEINIDSKILKTRRQAWIYTPPGYNPKRTDSYPVLICFDGEVYSTPEFVPTPTILDNLITAKKIRPMVGVFIGQSLQPGRNTELTNNEPFLAYVADELLPRVREKWHATSDPAQTVVCGSSSGGHASAFFAFRRPDVFGNVLSQSGAFWPGQTHEPDKPDREWLIRQFASSPKLPIRFVLQVGVLEFIATPRNGPSILLTNRHLRDVLTRKGYELYYNEIAGGHEPLSWRGGMAEGLIQLLGSANK
jgi:enterochelin esterase-like enzyme